MAHSVRSRRSNDMRKIQRALMGNYILEDLHDYRVDRHSFTIYVGADPHDEGDWEGNVAVEPGVTHHMANRLTMNLHILENMNPKKPILIIMATNGGDWNAGMQMYDAIGNCPNPITVLAMKHARSMSSLFPLVADRFLLTPSAYYLLHYGTFEVSGLSGEFANTMDEERRLTNDKMLRIYVARMKEQGKFKRTYEAEIRSMLEDRMSRKVDVFFSPQEAREWGFIDGIYTGKEPLRIQTRNEERRKRMTEATLAQVKIHPPKIVVTKKKS